MFQVTTPAASVPPPVADTNEAFAGTVSAITTAVAVAVPVLEYDSVYVMLLPALTGSGASVLEIVSTGFTTVVLAVELPGPPRLLQVSPYVVVTTSSLATARTPTAGSATTPSEVASDPENTPVFTPVSVTVTVSVSTVAGLFTETVKLCAVAGLVFRSASVTLMAIAWVGRMGAAAVSVPATQDVVTLVVAVTVAVPPPAVEAAL